MYQISEGLAPDIEKAIETYSDVLSEFASLCLATKTMQRMPCRKPI